MTDLDKRIDEIMELGSREIFMDNGEYLMCKITQCTTDSTTLTDKDFLLCWHEKKGDFIAKQGYGTWCEVGADRAFLEIKRLQAELAARERVIAEYKKIDELHEIYRQECIDVMNKKPTRI